MFITPERYPVTVHAELHPGPMIASILFRPAKERSPSAFRPFFALQPESAQLYPSTYPGNRVLLAFTCSTARVAAPAICWPTLHEPVNGRSRAKWRDSAPQSKPSNRTRHIVGRLAHMCMIAKHCLSQNHARNAGNCARLNQHIDGSHDGDADTHVPATLAGMPVEFCDRSLRDGSLNDIRLCGSMVWVSLVGDRSGNSGSFGGCIVDFANTCVEDVEFNEDAGRDGTLRESVTLREEDVEGPAALGNGTGKGRDEEGKGAGAGGSSGVGN